jgi:hypothetical protein
LEGEAGLAELVLAVDLEAILLAQLLLPVLGEGCLSFFSLTGFSLEFFLLLWGYLLLWLLALVILAWWSTWLFI